MTLRTPRAPLARYDSTGTTHPSSEIRLYRYHATLQRGTTLRTPRAPPVKYDSTGTTYSSRILPSTSTRLTVRVDYRPWVAPDLYSDLLTGRTRSGATDVCVDLIPSVFLVG